MLKMDKKIGEYFSIKEISGHRVDNIPSGLELMKLTQLICKVLDPIREKFGKTIITSGYRNKEYNKSVGGVNNSQHTKGEAVDFYCKNEPLENVFLWIINNLEFDQVIYEQNDQVSWIHISYKIKENRKKITYSIYDKKSKKMIYYNYRGDVDAISNR